MYKLLLIEFTNNTNIQSKIKYTPTFKLLATFLMTDYSERKLRLWGD